MNTQASSSSFYLGHWAWEMLACLFSLGCMAGLVAILVVFNGRQRSIWGDPYGISPNTAIAIFSTLAKTSMLFAIAHGMGHLKWIYFERREHKVSDLQVFDDASRGPLGSLLLLGQIRWRASIAAIGALVTVLMLAFDPFSQQILAFPLKPTIVVESQPAVKISRAFDLGGSLIAGVDTSLRPNDPGSPFNFFYLQDALLQGIYSPGQQEFHECSTGHCTWPAFDTLALCSKCTDVSQLINRDCYEVPLAEYWFREPNVTQYGQNCTFTYPNGAKLSAWTQTLGNVATQFNMTVRDVPDDSIDACPNTVANISILRFPWSNYSATNGKNWKLPTDFVGHECTLTCDLRFIQLFPSEPIEYPGGTMKSNGIYCIGYEQQHFPDFQPDFGGTEVQNLTRSQTTNVYVLGVQYGYFRDDIGYLLDVGYGGNNTAQESLLGSTLYRLNDGDIAQTLDNIAAAVTMAVRQGPNSTLHYGTASTADVYIAVRWPWLILPLSLVLLGVAFLVACIACPRKFGQAPWKESILALLFHGYMHNGGDWGQIGRSLSSEKEMEEFADEIRAQLRQDQKGQVGLVQRFKQ